MRIKPLRNMLLVTPESPQQVGVVVVVGPGRATRKARIDAVGPEVRDLREGQRVVANLVAGVTVGEQVLVTETAVVAVL